MVSTQLLQRYPFFAGLSHDRIVALAEAAEEVSVDAGHFFFHEDDELDHFFVTTEGEVAIVMELPDRGVEHTLARQFNRNYQTRDVIITTVGSGDVFGWSGLVPPHTCSAGAKALTPCRVIAFDCAALEEVFKQDGGLSYQMTERTAQVIRARMRAMRTMMLADLVA